MTDTKDSGTTPIAASPETPPTSEASKIDTLNADAPKAEPISSEIAKAESAPDTAPAAAVEEAPTRAAAILSRLKPGTRTKIAASIAAAAIIGTGIGAMGATGYAQRHAPLNQVSDAAAEANTLKTLLTQVGAEVASLKAALDSSARSTSTQLTKLSERMDRAEKAQVEPMARLARMSEAVERLEKQSAAGAPAFTTASASVTAPETTGSIVEKQQQRVDGWVLRDIYDGAALIEGRRGLVEVVPGTMLPGVGRVEQIRRINGRWAVVTSRGLITSR